MTQEKQEVSHMCEIYTPFESVIIYVSQGIYFGYKKREQHCRLCL